MGSRNEWELGLFFPPALIFYHLQSLLKTREDPASLPCKGGPLALEKYPTGREKNLKLGGAWPRERGRDSHLRGSPHPDVGLSPGPNYAVGSVLLGVKVALPPQHPPAWRSKLPRSMSPTPDR